MRLEQQDRASARYLVRVGTRPDSLVFDQAAWNAVAALGDTCTVFQQPLFLQCWWKAYGRGQLIVVSVESERGLVAVAPLFVDGAMAFFVGSGGSDYLDFIGGAALPGVLETIVGAVLERVPSLLGFRFYHVPDSSRTGARLRQVAAFLGMQCVDEGELVAPALHLGPAGGAGLQAAEKKSLVRHERGLNSVGTLSVKHIRKADEILARLDEFFDQHVRRWQATPFPSLFCEPAHRDFYMHLAAGADTVDWLRFTAVELDRRPIAFHFGFSFDGRYLWYKPSFEIELSRKSPGEALLRQLLLAAVDEGSRIFDFGLGDEAFKKRFADRLQTVRTWGLYPASSV